MSQQERNRAIEMNKEASSPVLVDLAAAGYRLDWVSDLYTRRLNYKSAIPILLEWLPRSQNIDLKEEIVRALSVSWAKPIASSVLLAEFRKLEQANNDRLRWAIANALSVVADDSVSADIVELIQDLRYGKAREMLALALGNMKEPYVQDVLINLLDDAEIVGHVVIALGKLKSKKAKPYIEPLLAHPKAWVRKEAMRALKKIDKVP
jgi:HEAT repeat protein